ncbi:unnamed protein product [Periconia digitata]|uniref:Uncharacterized protein n=1 Tax=Periconia digitata TaxID=1303443 RepID=A0A9W4URA2_9PLEO|nr:unnamed protein product [Periconia digitata]
MFIRTAFHSQRYYSLPRASLHNLPLHNLSLQPTTHKPANRLQPWQSLKLALLDATLGPRNLRGVPPRTSRSASKPSLSRSLFRAVVALPPQTALHHPQSRRLRRNLQKPRPHKTRAISQLPLLPLLQQCPHSPPPQKQIP